MGICSKCGIKHQRNGRYCHVCHAAYQRNWRKKKTKEVESLRRYNAALRSELARAKQN